MGQELLPLRSKVKKIIQNKNLIGSSKARQGLASTHYWPGIGKALLKAAVRISSLFPPSRVFARTLVRLSGETKACTQSRSFPQDKSE
jgi:hypothetical protein